MPLKKAIEYNNTIYLFFFTHKSLTDVEKRSKNYTKSLENIEKLLAFIEEVGYKASKMNLILMKAGTIKRTKYLSLDELNNDLIQFLVHYNLYRRYGSLIR
jgi:hypothetical protein